MEWEDDDLEVIVPIHKEAKAEPKVVSPVDEAARLQQEQKQQAKRLKDQSVRICVTNLPSSAREPQLMEMTSRFDPWKASIKDNLAYLFFVNTANADRCQAEFNGVQLGGRTLSFSRESEVQREERMKLKESKKLKARIAENESLLDEMINLNRQAEADNKTINTAPIDWDLQKPGWTLYNDAAIESYTLNNVYPSSITLNEWRPISAVYLKLQPFDNGTFRRVYHMQTEDGGRYVAKSFLVSKGKEADLEAYMEGVELQLVAEALAAEFRNISGKQLAYLPLELLHIPSEDQHMSIEPILPNEPFRKFNNNFGFVRPDYVVPQEFSHFTFDKTRGNIMVVDLQGVARASGEYVLTDPALHCVDVKKYGLANYGQKGFEAFFKTHKCTSFCRNFLKC